MKSSLPTNLWHFCVASLRSQLRLIVDSNATGIDTLIVQGHIIYTWDLIYIVHSTGLDPNESCFKPMMLPYSNINQPAAQKYATTRHTRWNQISKARTWCVRASQQLLRARMENWSVLNTAMEHMPNSIPETVPATTYVPMSPVLPLSKMDDLMNSMKNLLTNSIIDGSFASQLKKLSG